jgi:hypothetical protein
VRGAPLATLVSSVRVEDTNRILEKKALRNVRALVDNLARREPDQQGLLALLVVGILIVVAAAAAWVFSLPKEAAEAAKRQQLSCQLDAWASKAGDLERSLQKAHPEMSYREIQKLMERERPFVMAAAKVECDARSK